MIVPDPSIPAGHLQVDVLAPDANPKLFDCQSSTCLLHPRGARCVDGATFVSDRPRCAGKIRAVRRPGIRFHQPFACLVARGSDHHGQVGGRGWDSRPEPNVRGYSTGPMRPPTHSRPKPDPARPALTSPAQPSAFGRGPKIGRAHGPTTVRCTAAERGYPPPPCPAADVHRSGRVCGDGQRVAGQPQSVRGAIHSPLHHR